jgi:hypothetical protein
MQDDFRVRLEIGEEEGARAFVRHLRGHGVADEARSRLDDRVIVTHGDGVLTAYADTPELARACAALLEDLAREHGRPAEAEISRWHPEEERWEPFDVPLPSTPEEHAAERARLEALEEAESASGGAPEWEVRIDLPGEGETEALAARLEAEGVRCVRRWRFLLVSVDTEREAQALAERVRAEAGEGGKVTVEAPEVMGDSWRRLHPFAWLGGLGN